MLTRLGWRLARSDRRDGGWRQAAMAVSTLIAGVLVLAGCSVLMMAVRENDREADRSSVRAIEPSPTDLLVIAGFDFWEGRQFPALWIEPSDPQEATVLPPGLQRLPPPGVAAVSPALDAAARSDPLLAERYPQRVVLGTDGYVAGDELIAWIRTTNTQSFPEGRADAIAGFGEVAGRASGSKVGVTEDTVVFPLVLGVVILLLVPALALLAAGAVTSAPTRDHRLEILHRLGLRHRTLTAVVAVETATLALPGAVVAAIAWRLVAPRLSVVPLVARHVQRGDLGLPIWLGAVVTAGIVAAAMAIAVVGLRSPGRVHTPRPVVVGERVSIARLLPLLVGLGISAYASLGTGRGAALQLLAGTALCIVSIPLTAPYALRRSGEWLARLQARVPAVLAGRRLARDPGGSTRPVLALAAFLVVAPAAMAFVAVVGADDEPGRVAERQAVAVSSSAGNESWQRFEDRLDGTGVVVPVAQDERIRLFVECPRLADAVPGVACDVEGRITRGSLDTLADVLRVPPDVIELTADQRPARLLDAFVIGPSTDEFAQQVRASALVNFVAPNVSTTEQPGRDPLVAWIISGLICAAVIAATALVVSALDRFVSNRRPHGQLLAVGLLPHTIRSVERTYFGVAYGVITSIGLAIGVLVTWLFVRMQPDAEFPGIAIGTIAVITIGIGVLGSLLVGSAAGRAAGRDDRGLGDSSSASSLVNRGTA